MSDLLDLTPNQLINLVIDVKEMQGLSVVFIKLYVKTYGFIDFYSIDDGAPVGFPASLVSVVFSILLLMLLVQVDLISPLAGSAGAVVINRLVTWLGPTTYAISVLELD